MVDFFMDNTVLDVYYNAAEHTIAIPLGVLVTPDSEYYNMEYPDNYLMLYRPDAPTIDNIKSGYLYGKISDDNNTITISGIAAGYGLGLCNLSYDGYHFYDNLYYTRTNTITLHKTIL
jgi:hypothetical protein